MDRLERTLCTHDKPSRSTPGKRRNEIFGLFAPQFSRSRLDERKAESNRSIVANVGCVGVNSLAERGMRLGMTIKDGGSQATQETRIPAGQQRSAHRRQRLGVLEQELSKQRSFGVGFVVHSHAARLVRFCVVGSDGKSTIR